MRAAEYGGRVIGNIRILFGVRQIDTKTWRRMIAAPQARSGEDQPCRRKLSDSI